MFMTLVVYRSSDQKSVRVVASSANLFLRSSHLLISKVICIHTQIGLMVDFQWKKWSQKRLI